MEAAIVDLDEALTESFDGEHCIRWARRWKGEYARLLEEKMTTMNEDEANETDEIDTHDNTSAKSNTKRTPSNNDSATEDELQDDINLMTTHEDSATEDELQLADDNDSATEDELQDVDKDFTNITLNRVAEDSETEDVMDQDESSAHQGGCEQTAEYGDVSDDSYKQDGEFLFGDERENIIFLTAACDTPIEPLTYRKAMMTSQAENWEAAVWLEVDQMYTKMVFEIVELPLGRKPITTRWVFKIKYNPDGSIEKYKARLVARGFLQREGIDFKETFAATVHPTSVRILLALAALFDWYIHQLDAVAAFLNADVEEEIYVVPPEPIKLPKGKVWRMRKALYGFKQSPRAWYAKFAKEMKDLGFRPSNYDSCVFINTETNVIVTLHVDDMKILGPDEEAIIKFKNQLKAIFEMTDVQDKAAYLGMEIKRTSDSIRIHQSAYADKILKRFNMTETTPSYTPIEKKLKKNEEDNCSEEFRHEYLSKFGSLNYLPTVTRPDLAFGTGLLGRFSSNPGQVHMDAADRTLGYLAQTKDYGITYSRHADNPKLEVYVDADWGGCEHSAKSTTGWVAMLAGGPISWASQRQKVPALSTCEAEYVAAAEACKEALWIQGFINDLELNTMVGTVPIYFRDGSEMALTPIPLYIDNQATIKLTKNPENHQRAKHINIKHHMIRRSVTDNQIRPVWISGSENMADILTKALPRPTFEKLRDLLNVHSVV